MITTRAPDGANKESQKKDFRLGQYQQPKIYDGYIIKVFQNLRPGEANNKTRFQHLT